MNNKQVTDIANLYKSIYEEKEENLNENPLLDRVRDTARSTVVDAGGKIGERVGKGKAGLLGGFLGKRKGEKTAGTAFDQATSGNVGGAVKTVQDALRETKDSFDIIKDHLIDEGYADTEQEALKIMVTMTDEERLAILESPQPTKKIKKNPDGSMIQQTRNADGSRGPDIHLDRPGDGTKGTRLTIPFSNSAPGAEPGLW